MTSHTSYANIGACRRAAKRACFERGDENPQRGKHFQLHVDADKRWSFTLLTPKVERPLTREEWLVEGVERMHAEVFTPIAGIPSSLPSYRVSCGFPLGARPYQAGSSKGVGQIGECWSSRSSKDGATEMMVSPILDDPTRVLGVLAHEMCHMYLGVEEGHGPVFKALATAIGLTGKMTATTEGPEFLAAVAPILADMGPYPHAALDASRKKKDTIRQIKVQCDEEACGCTFRLARKWIEAAAKSEQGALSCPICQGPVTVTLPD